MDKRSRVGIAVIAGILIFDILVYKYQDVNCLNALVPICYPSGKIEYDSIDLVDQTIK